MNSQLKALAIVLALSFPCWIICWSFCRSAVALDDYRRRFCCWLFVTVVGFLAPTFYFYALFSAPVMYWCARRDSTPQAAFLILMYAVPDTRISLPTFVINELLQVGHIHLATLTMLLPAMVRRKGRTATQSKSNVPAAFVLIFALTVTASGVPHENITHTARRVVSLGIEYVIPFFAFLRMTQPRKSAEDCFRTWILGGAVLGCIATFETLSSWLLYVDIAARWGEPNRFAYLLRSSALRAQASAGHSLFLGYYLAVAWGFLVYLWKTNETSSDKGIRLTRIAPVLTVGAILLAGLTATFSRGPWLTAAVVIATFLALQPRESGNSAKAAGALLIISIVLYFSPVLPVVLDYLPFIGSVDSYNVEYRRRLIEVSMHLIMENLWWGSPYVTSQMESLRQGQGIIDIINGYLQIALYNGVIALMAFIACLIWPLLQHLAAGAKQRLLAPAEARRSALIAAVLMGTIFFIATANHSFITFTLLGLATALVTSSRSLAVQKVTRPA